MGWYDTPNQFNPENRFIGDIEDGKSYPYDCYTKAESDERYAQKSAETDISELAAEVEIKADKSEIEAARIMALSNKAYTTLGERLDANNNYVTPEMFGAVGDGITDDTQAIQNAINATENTGSYVYCLNKTYLCSGSLFLKNRTTMIGNKSRLLYTGKDRFIRIVGIFVTLDGFEIEKNSDSTDNTSKGVSVTSGSDAGYARAFRNINICNCKITNFYKAGIALDNMWQVTISNCVITGRTYASGESSYGISYEASGEILSLWSGSGNIIQSVYISNCNYAFHLKSAWNVTVVDSIVEHCERSIYKTESGTPTYFINCWFEANYNPSTLLGSVILIGGRTNILAGSSDLEFPSDTNNLTMFKNGFSARYRGRDMLSYGPGKTTIISGLKNKVEMTDFEKIISMQGFSSYYNVNPVDPEQSIKDANLVGELSIMARGSGQGQGHNHGVLRFEAAENDGNYEYRALQPVFEVNDLGTIWSPAANDLNADIGKVDYPYSKIYARALYLTGDNDDLYKLTIVGGQLTVTEVQIPTPEPDTEPEPETDTPNE